MRTPGSSLETTVSSLEAARAGTDTSRTIAAGRTSDTAMHMKLGLEIESWPYKVPFRVSRGAEEALGVVVVTLTDADGRVGRGEAAGVDYDGETVESMCGQI